MAYYAALVSVEQLIEEISHDHDPYHKNFLLRNEQIIKCLHEKIGILIVSLKDYESKGDESTDCLEIRIRDAAYKAQDIIESSQVSSDIHPEYDDGSTHGVDTELTRYNMEKEYQDLRKVEEEIDSILVDVDTIKVSHKTEDLQLSYDSPDIGGGSESEQLATKGESSTMVGFDEHVTTIKGQILTDSPELQIVPIVGLGGIGKTTLAKNIFEDKLIVEKFDIRIWVTVSQDYHIQKVLRTILDSTNKDTQELRDLGQRELSLHIYQQLTNRTYLIIMDDIWSTKVLDDVKWIFPDDGNRSRIILTTRVTEVACYSTLGSLHQMDLLNEEQSWNLFREKVFGKEEDCPHELVDIGNLIINKCRGLPLAIIVVAGVLYGIRRTRHDWEKIARNVSSVVTENDKDFSKILSLSYNKLPHHLKACFLHIGSFPEDYEISVSKLIKLWIAEGFLRPTECKSLDEVGEEYLENLFRRNLVMINKKRSNGKFKFCSIHDLLRDLCAQRVRYENFFHVTDENGYIPIGGENVRRACVCSYRRVFGLPRLITAEYASSHVRSILCFGNCFVDNWSLLGIRRLRVLDALEIRLHYFPDVILEPFHLRYLAFYLDPYSSTRVRVSPSISKLEKLQTFIVTLGSKHDILLPTQIWKMPQLRHLMIDKMSLSPIPINSERMVGEVYVLEHLRTLYTLEDFIFTTESLGMIPNLNMLKVRYTDTAEKGNWEIYCLNNLVSLSQLEELTIIFSLSSNSSLQGCVNPLPKSFVFPQNLKKLSLRGCRIPWEDLTAVGSLPNLEVLKLQENAMIGEKWEPNEEEFLQLKFLLMEELDLTYWRAEDTHFPILEHLKIEKCWLLQEIPLGIGDIPTLQLIEVNDSKPASASAMLIQDEQESQGNNALQVRVY